jgi:lipopolysaccharide export LptBFGC system permease protein LptF
MGTTDQPDDWRRYRQRLQRRWILVAFVGALLVIASLVGLAVDRTGQKATLATVVGVLGIAYFLAMVIGLLAGPTRRVEPRGRWERFLEWCRTLFLVSP